MARQGGHAAKPRHRGTNQSGLRQYNERLVLSLIRRFKALPKAEIARKTGLTAQTISVIMNRLEADRLVVKQAPVRGRVGQPSVPFALNPDGAFSLGLKVGRRSFDLSLVDFVGNVRSTLRETFSYPAPARLEAFVAKGVDVLTSDLAPGVRTRIAGLGVATPYELWSWSEELHAPSEAMQEWRHFDFESVIGGIWGGPVYVRNDATAACAAELIFGNPERHVDFLYLYIGAFVGGGVVLGGSLFVGPHGNAGAIGSLPVPTLTPSGALGTEQLILRASKLTLERKLRAAGRDATAIWTASEAWSGLDPMLEDWIEEVASGLAHAVVSAISVIDFPVAVIDGAMPVGVRADIVRRTREKLGAFNRQGLSPVEIVEGTIGVSARTLGSASLPLLADFAIDSSVLFKPGQ